MRHPDRRSTTGLAPASVCATDSDEIELMASITNSRRSFCSVTMFIDCLTSPALTCPASDATTPSSAAPCASLCKYRGMRRPCSAARFAKRSRSSHTSAPVSRGALSNLLCRRRAAAYRGLIGVLVDGSTRCSVKNPSSSVAISPSELRNSARRAL